MRVLLLEESADGMLDLAIRAKRAGHQARYHVGGDRTKHPTGRGLVEYVGDWRPSVGWADLIIAGGQKWVRELDAARRRGVPMIGGHAEVAQLELDRLAGMAAFKKHGIPIPPFRECRGLDEAIAYVADKGEGFAAKPSGNVGDKALSFVGKTAEETIWRLKRWKREGKAFPQGLMLQERVKGIEFAVGGWLGPAGFAPGWEENFEHKKLFAGDLGPNTGEQGTVMRLVRSSKLADKVLAPFEDRLVAQGYVGNFDVNCIVGEDGTPYPLEFTCRLGWPSTNIELALHDGDPIEFMAALAAGERPRKRRLNEIAVGVVMAIPPYPYGHEKPDEVVGVPLWGVTPGIEDCLHYADVMLGDAPVVRDGRCETRPQLSASGSYVLVATGCGDTVVVARRQAERVLSRLSLPASPFWRNDIGVRLRGQLPKLQAHGYAVGMSYSD